MTIRRFLLFACFYAFFGLDGARAQTPIPPDCKITFNFTATGRTPSAGFPNGTPSEPGCVTWTMVYYVSGFSAISVRLESAPDSSGSAGTWVAFAGTTIFGVNPGITTTQNFYSAYGYNPWVSVNLTSVTGTGNVKGTAYGWKLGGFLPVSATITPSGTQDVNLIQVGGAAVALGQAAMASSIPVAIASNQSAVAVAGTGAAIKTDSQGNLYDFLGCTLTAETTLSGTGYNEVVIGTAAQVIHVCKVIISSATGGSPNVNNFSLVSATITTCAGTTELFALNSVTGMDTDWGGALASAAGKSLCFSESVANGDKITISYVKF
jgi:hypothetical protein